jgi:TctA family transporter
MELPEYGRRGGMAFSVALCSLCASTINTVTVVVAAAADGHVSHELLPAPYYCLLSLSLSPIPWPEAEKEKP